jgi:hypothetical protein
MADHQVNLRPVTTKSVSRSHTLPVGHLHYTLEQAQDRTMLHIYLARRIDRPVAAKDLVNLHKNPDVICHLH